MTEQRSALAAQQAHDANKLAYEIDSWLRDGEPTSMSAATKVASDCRFN